MGKMNGLVRSSFRRRSGAVLMLGYMNREALAATEATGRVTFWSAARALWTKGENVRLLSRSLQHQRGLRSRYLLILAQPAGPACHLGTATCWGEDAPRSMAHRLEFLGRLEQIVAQRIADPPSTATPRNWSRRA